MSPSQTHCHVELVCKKTTSTLTFCFTISYTTCIFSNKMAPNTDLSWGGPPSRVDWHNAKFDMPPIFFPSLGNVFASCESSVNLLNSPITLFYKGNTLTSIVVFVDSFQPPDIIVRVRYQMHVYHLILYRAESEASADNEQQTNRPTSHCRTMRIM